MTWVILTLVLAALGFLALVGWQLHRRHMLRWLPAYVRDTGRRRAPRPTDEVHVLICLADHYEPKAYGADAEAGRRRVAAWAEQYPRQFARCRDSDGRPPRYTFFFPAEEYERDYLDSLADLCRAGYGEVEIHLHHNRDTADNLRHTLTSFRDLLATEHGLLAHDRQTGQTVYGFIHGNWALCNSRAADGFCCGVNNELEILHETGCYADFTYPSAPDVSQPPLFNQLYYAWDHPGQRRSHETGLPVGTGTPPPGALLMVPGPLTLDWTQRKAGLFPALENSCLQATQPPSIARLANWLRARIQVPQRPDWFFVKLHAHGAPEVAHEALLGAPMVRFHADLARLAAANPRFHYHYVTARELANLVHAAESGYTGPVAGALDYRYVSNLSAVVRGTAAAAV